MQKIVSFTLRIFSLALCIAGCNKNDEDSTPTEVDPGTFIATLNGVAWNPPKHRAVYYPKWHQLYISASDYAHTFTVGINTDSTALLKTYLLESHGDNVAELKANTEQYNSDHNKADAGGHFLLTKFDTAQKTVSGTLQAVCYSPDKAKKMVLSSAITNIPVTIDTAAYDGSYAVCTVTGAATTTWHAKDFFARITCLSNGVDKTLELHIASVLGDAPFRRYLLLKIPLNNGVGDYPVYPDMPPDSYYCGDGKILSRYNVNNYDDSYYTTSGRFSITGIDTARRKLNAHFDLVFKDTTSPQETIRISNGVLQLNNWKDL